MFNTDLKLTPTGDIMFCSNRDDSSKIIFNFLVTNSAPIILNFNCHTEDISLTTSSNALQLDFTISDTISKTNSVTTNTDEYIKQLCLIRLRTVLGELKYRTSLGSRLELAMHKNLFLEETKNEVTKYVAEAINDILPNADIECTPMIINKLNGYKQVMKIAIKDNGDLIATDYIQ